MRKNLLYAAILLAGCAAKPEVNITLVDTKTALENQVLGTYSELGKKALNVSIRDSGEVKNNIARTEKEAVLAMQNREFNQDDIDSFKEKNFVGEGKSGFLKIFEEALKNESPKITERVNRIVAEENRDRLVIMERILTINNMTEKDLPKIQSVFAKMFRNSSKKGELIETDEGLWIRKE